MLAHLGAMLAQLGAMLAHLGPMLAYLGPMLAHLDANLTQLGANLTSKTLPKTHQHRPQNLAALICVIREFQGAQQTAGYWDVVRLPPLVPRAPGFLSYIDMYM